MGKRTRKQNNRKGLVATIATLTVVLVALLLVFLFSGRVGDDPTTPAYEIPIKTLTIESVEEQKSTMVVKTTYGQFSYPFAFSDLLHIEEENEISWSALHFYLYLQGKRYAIYSIFFNEGDGEPIGLIDLGDEWTETLVTVVFHSLPTGMNEEFERTFYATQETFNDVLVSLEENDSFTSA